MSNSVAIKYLEIIKEKKGVKSKYALAKLLEISKQRINGYYNQGKRFDMYITFKIAELLDIEPDDIIIEMSHEKAKNPKEREFWLKKAKLISTGITMLVGAETVDYYMFIECILC